MQITNTSKRVCKDFDRKEFGEYQNLYVWSNTLLLADVFGNFSSWINFSSAPGLTWQVDLEKDEVKFDLLTDIHILLVVEKGIIGRICCFIYGYVKANSKYTKDYDKNKESSYLQYWDVNNLYAWEIS